MGFGMRLSSNFANRFTFALRELLMRRVDAAEDVLFDAEVDSSRRAWVARRRALSARTGRNQCCLYALAAYTDDFKFQAAGIGGAMRIMAVWYTLTRELNLRITIPAKREAGTSAIWLGLRGYASLGYEVIPRAKQSRAIYEMASCAFRHITRSAQRRVPIRRLSAHCGEFRATYERGVAGRAPSARCTSDLSKLHNNHGDRGSSGNVARLVCWLCRVRMRTCTRVVAA